MSDEEGLLQAIGDNPEDDAPRLMYADYLDEHGDSARAEFIRVQCALARLPFEDERVSELQAREFRLLSRHGMDWLAGGPEGPFRRGFREEWKFDRPVLFALTGGKLCARRPVREVQFGDQDEPGWGRLVADAPHLARVEAIRLGWRHPNRALHFSDVLAVLSSPHLTRLTTLDLSGGHDYGDDALLALFHTPRRTGLRRLSLSGTDVTDNGLRALLGSPLAETLTHLDLSGCGGITEEGICALIDSPLWPRLEELNLGELHFPSSGMFWLVAEALPRSRLTRLGLKGPMQEEPRGLELAQGLEAVSSWGRLEALDLTRQGLSGPGLKTLTTCPHLAGLRWLILTSNYLTVEDAERLAACPYLAGLTALSVYSAEFGDAGLETLARSPHLRRLVYLDANNTEAGDAGLAALARSPVAARLRVLSVPAVGDEGLWAVADSPYFTRLTTLVIGGQDSTDRGLTDAGALALVRSTNLPNLAHVDPGDSGLQWPGATEVGVRAMMECERLAWYGWPEVLGSSPELLRAQQARFNYFNGPDMLPGDLLLLFPWARCACS